HRQRNGARANKFDLPREDVFRIVVEADDEASHHLHAVALNLPARIEQVAAPILSLLRFDQTRLNRRLDAEEDAPKPRAPHTVEQIFVFSQVHAGFSNKSEWLAVPLRPRGPLRSE